ncbi:putative Cytosolic Protein [Lactiplantibacillus plantarum]|nr:putative Cytosolic Protein [Lactiplantibacillus plantarum]KZT92043.1 putative Cytosolic Protein [Lactiplantibacillus plantarum]KZU16905.1 putative Cytosolic Protein [Lactiplantibacillus plantarum]KZU60516.1 putative Cytosolic Protein [Lactiplantibacillus plantarum]KZU65089.1 putative Cytosolic Protein [Lactiplantibacillus plantarum]
MDESQIPAATTKIKKLNFVRRVEPSYRPDVAMNFGERVDQGFFKPTTTGAPDDDDED